MRIVLALAALVTTPLAVGVSQSRGLPRQYTDAAYCGVHLKHLASVSDHNSAPDQVPAHGGKHGVMDSPCAPPPPPPPPPPAPSSGDPVIDGRVVDNDTWLGLANWAVTIGGTVSASVTTDSEGRYAFSGLPGGDYVVCVIVQDGWTQLMPTMSAPCPSGMGYAFTLVNGETAQFVNFTAAKK